ncbi:unnamed protein product [Closterium sp. NIES-65]|nr:unnamed protein product [Closterium sp. NIES-65]
MCCFMPLHACPVCPAPPPRLAVGWLTITAMRASNLRNQGLVGTSDPYLHFYLTSSLGSRESSVRDNDLNPDWGDEELRLKVLDPATQKLHVEVFDKNTVSRYPGIPVSRYPGIPVSRYPGIPVSRRLKRGCGLGAHGCGLIHVETHFLAFVPSIPVSLPRPSPYLKPAPAILILPHFPSQGKVDRMMGVQVVAVSEIAGKADRLIGVQEVALSEGKADRLMGVQLVALSKLAVGEAKDFELRLAPRFSDLGGAQSGGRSRRDIGSVCFRLLYNPLGENEAPPPMDVEEMQEEEAEAFPEWVPVGGGLLRVILKRGEGLEARHHANPFVVLRFRNQEWQSQVGGRTRCEAGEGGQNQLRGRNGEWQRQHYKKQADVVFEEEPFEVFLEKPPVSDTLHIKVFSKSLSSFSVLSKEAVGYCEIQLSDVVINGRINDLYPLIDSKGQLQLELQWHRRTDASQVAEETSLATRVGQMIQQTAVGNIITQTVNRMENASEEIKARWQQP